MPAPRAYADGGRELRARGSASRGGGRGLACAWRARAGARRLAQTLPCLRIQASTRRPRARATAASWHTRRWRRDGRSGPSVRAPARGAGRAVRPPPPRSSPRQNHRCCRSPSSPSSACTPATALADCNGSACVNGTCACDARLDGRALRRGRARPGHARLHDAAHVAGAPRRRADSSNRYYAFAMALKNRCGIYHYRHNSYIVRGTATSPLGPLRVRRRRARQPHRAAL